MAKPEYRILKNKPVLNSNAQYTFFENVDTFLRGSGISTYGGDDDLYISSPVVHAFTKYTYKYTT